MNSLTYKKIVNGLAIAGVIVAILIPDVILELIAEGFHLLLESIEEVLHIVFEWLESALDHVIEHFFETELHDTQIIVFYIIMACLSFVGYRLALKVPRLYRRLADWFMVMLEVNKVRVYMYWYSLTLLGRVKLVGAVSAVILSYLFLGM